MKIRFKWFLLLPSSIIVCCYLIVFSWFSFRLYTQLEIWLNTKLHEAELRPPVEKYLGSRGEIEKLDETALSQFLTGRRLEDFKRYRCPDCPTLSVSKGFQIQKFEVLKYTGTTSIVRFRWEEGWETVDSKTRAVIGPCYVDVSEGALLLVREEKIWKVADVVEFSPSRNSPAEEVPRLKATYCPTK